MPDAPPARHGLLQFTVWNAPRGELWTEEQEKDDAWHRFVLLDTDADGQLTAEASRWLRGGPKGGLEGLRECQELVPFWAAPANRQHFRQPGWPALC